MPPAAARRLGRFGVKTAGDLLFHLPRRYDDVSELSTLAELRESAPEGPVAAAVEVVSIDVQQTFRRRIQKTIARLRDDTGEGEAIWFGRRFIERRIAPGQRVLLSGRLEVRGWLPQFQNPEFGPAEGDSLHAGRIVPVYRLTAGVTAPVLRRAVRTALDRVGGDYPEYLPAKIRAASSEVLPGIAQALEAAHYPPDLRARDDALHRLAFDELLALQVGMVARERQRRGVRGIPVEVAEKRLAEAIGIVEGVLAEGVRRRRARAAEYEAARAAAAMASPAAGGETPPADVTDGPIRLTTDQSDALAAIRADLSSGRPMLRLLQGDVGSGKTAVAALALAFVADAGHQGALLAPTDLLARQHAATLAALLEPLGHRVTLLTGSLAAPERRRALELIAAPLDRTPEGRSAGRVVIGTHALVQEAVAFADLTLAVVDEQHRFGVAEREALSAKGRWPHVLLMTATPIPQTLGRVIHADLEVSDLRQAPEGRVPILTGVRRSDQLLRVGDDPAKGAYPLILREIAAGHRAFVVVPLVEEDESGAARSAEATAAEVERILGELETEHHEHPGIRVGVVHGQMKAAERDARMEAFRAGETSVLVGTTVLEVGVDVPEATVMLVLDADRFGIAQLHQLRGRVGRGEAASYCILVSDSEDETARARLRTLEETRDGFALAEMDLALRREGELLGLSQSGLPPLRVATLRRRDHQVLSVKARALAETLVDEAGTLRPGHERFAHELEHGWLARVGAGEVLATGEEPA
ncbi:MAG TPA: ATP-dependent DNA helicase RecG [Candidatus Limnocylindrales bacterium]|jgi:ATP-dependent DNA helicase RecG|nr:ATP-dependent DNA helicase RecG [Candidatus Limnocylindrales bacterium]